MNARNAIARVTAEGGIETVVTAEDGPLDFPSDVAFGTTRDELETLFVTNFAVLNFLSEEATAQPSLMGVDLGTPGLPTSR